MKLTLLIDLDDTLLENDIYKFLPHYLSSLGKHLSAYVDPERMARELMAATGVMAANEKPTRSLEATFDASFYPAIGVQKQDLVPALRDFYENVFPTLQYLTRPRAAASRLVRYLISQGHTIIIATNPLFPIRAIEHRLAWADLPVDRYPFALVSSFEAFHYAKPDPGFLAECLARIGWPSQPVAIIGNSEKDDLVPAKKLGIPGFLVTSAENETDPTSKRGFPDGQGSLEDAIPWIEALEKSAAVPSYDTPEAMVAVLRSTPAVIDTLSQSIPSARWNQPPHPGEWSFTEIICHLRDSDAEINLPRMERILREKNAFIPAVNADVWSSERAYNRQSGPTALAEFADCRMELVRRLRDLSQAEWESPANHAIFGPTTLHELVGFIAQHDRTHVQQAIHAVVG